MTGRRSARRCPTSLLLGVQLLAALLVLIGIVLIPPARGFMLIVPLDGQRQGVTANWAAAAGASFVAGGPVRGSLVVIGSRAHLLPAALRHASLLVSAYPRTCGALRSKAA